MIDMLVTINCRRGMGWEAQNLRCVGNGLARELYYVNVLFLSLVTSPMILLTLVQYFGSS